MSDRPLATTDKGQSLAESDWSSLLARAADDVSRILQSEVRLLTTSLGATFAEQVDRVLATLAVAAVMLLAGLCLVAAVIMFIHQWLAWWASLAITAGLLIVIAMLVQAAGGRSKSSQH